MTILSAEGSSRSKHAFPWFWFAWRRRQFFHSGQDTPIVRSRTCSRSFRRFSRRCCKLWHWSRPAGNLCSRTRASFEAVLTSHEFSIIFGVWSRYVLWKCWSEWWSWGRGIHRWDKFCIVEGLAKFSKASPFERSDFRCALSGFGLSFRCSNALHRYFLETLS